MHSSSSWKWIRSFSMSALNNTKKSRSEYILVHTNLISPEILKSLLLCSYRKEKDRRKEDIWCRIEELAKRNPNYAPNKNNSIESSCEDTGFGEQEPDIDMSYEKVQAESKKVSRQSAVTKEKEEFELTSFFHSFRFASKWMLTSHCFDGNQNCLMTRTRSKLWTTTREPTSTCQRLRMWTNANGSCHAA